MNFGVIIPARYGSSRFPGKPLAEIGGERMVVRVARRAQASAAREVVVATDDERILEACRVCGIRAVLTPGYLRTGTDRVAAAAEALGWRGTIVNVQGDQPFIDPALINKVAQGLRWFELCTAAQDRAGGVRVTTTLGGIATDFSRKDRVASLYHIGIYAYEAEALAELAALPTSPGEAEEDLEQLRALEDGMRIRVVLDDGPLAPEVNTPEDLAAARLYAGF